MHTPVARRPDHSPVVVTLNTLNAGTIRAGSPESVPDRPEKNLSKQQSGPHRRP
jgi:hypothetical protein